jgi:hypothetical protein
MKLQVWKSDYEAEGEGRLRLEMDVEALCMETEATRRKNKVGGQDDGRRRRR